MKLELQNNIFTITKNGETIADKVSFFKKYWDAEEETEKSAFPRGEWKHDGNKFFCDNYTIEYEDIAENAITVKTTFRNTLSVRVGNSPFIVFSGKLKFKTDICLYTHNDISEFRSSPTMLSMPETGRLMDGSTLGGSDVIAFTKRDGQNDEGAVLGFAEYETYANNLVINGNGTFEAMQLPDDGFLMSPGESVTSDKVYFSVTTDIKKGLPEFAQKIGKMNGVTGKWPETPFGWCSWYYYLGDFTPDEIRTNVKTLSSLKDRLPVKYIQIDDGWQRCIGGWEGKEELGFDMKKLADEIKAEGFIPGIWFCPTWIGQRCSIFKDRQDLLVKKRNSDENACFLSLDITIPEVEKYLRDLMHKITYEWGFRYIKYDFMKSAITDGERRDKSVTGLGAYRKVLRILREAAAPGTFILNCTAPLIPSVGLCDGMRVTCDIGHDWLGVKEVAIRAIKRWYMHKNLFINDADCMLSRKSENEDELCNRRCTRNDDELRTFATVMAASGGILMLSDKMSLLGEEQISLLEKLYPLNETAAVPLDITQRTEPAILDFGTKNNVRRIAFINWEDDENTYSLPLDKEYSVYEFWTKEKYGNLDNLELTVKPHCTKLVLLLDKDTEADETLFEHIT